VSTTDSRRLREAADIAARFGIRAPPERIEPLGKGLINDTFVVGEGGQQWVLQRINPRVFPRPEAIMENLARLSEVLSGRLDGLRVPALLPAADGSPWVRAGDGGCWRLMELIEGGRTLTRIEDPAQAEEAGRALGSFHRALAGLDPGGFRVTLPGFHDTPRHVGRLLRVAGRVALPAAGEAVGRAIAFVRERRGPAGTLERARRAGVIPERVIHGDPKLDNLLYDRSRRRALALIDLDTVQPGLAHYDVGDGLRSCCNRGGEQGAGSGVAFDLSICAAWLRGYAGRTRGFLRPAETDLLYEAIRIVPLELGVRFLTDHLQGDRWFRVAAPGENLTKALTQLALVGDIERKESAIRAIILACFPQPGPESAAVP
jgi:Ser/Thr protein kinase RdoA (MazF antagonist)